jgi:hypothetical protein
MGIGGGGGGSGDGGGRRRDSGGEECTQERDVHDAGRARLKNTNSWVVEAMVVVEVELMAVD